MRSLLARLTLLQQVATLAAIALFAVLAMAITAGVMRAERHAFVSRTAARLADGYAQELVDEPDPEAAARSMVEDGLDVGLRVEVRDSTGRVLASSLAPSGPSRTDPGRPAGDGTIVATASGPHGVRVAVAGGGGAERSHLSALARSLLIAGLPILAFSLLFGRWLVARSLRPLSEMADRAGSLSADRHPRSLGARSGLDELDRLAVAFDRLLERLDDALSAERRLTADASHELRTPLTVLGGELDLLREAAARDSRGAAGLERAAGQVAAMRELVDAVLLLHRSGEAGAAEATGFEVLNLADLAREALAEACARHPGRESDARLAAPDEVLVEGNTALLAAAARNLLDNAFKFSRTGDRVAVEVSAAAGSATLAVDDAGPGIPDSERERVFDPFFRGAGARSGAAGFGLGLPILRRVARAHGGDVTSLPSALGGARFVLTLPVHGAPPGEGGVPATSARRAPPSGAAPAGRAATG